jgi:hypothetical protein
MKILSLLSLLSAVTGVHMQEQTCQAQTDLITLQM